jgi:hypothetical protein
MKNILIFLVICLTSCGYNTMEIDEHLLIVQNSDSLIRTVQKSGDMITVKTLQKIKGNSVPYLKTRNQYGNKPIIFKVVRKTRFTYNKQFLPEKEYILWDGKNTCWILVDKIDLKENASYFGILW